MGRGAAGLASQGTLLELPQCRLEQLAKILVPRPPRLFPPTPAQRRPALPRARGLPTFEGLSARWAVQGQEFAFFDVRVLCRALMDPARRDEALTRAMETQTAVFDDVSSPQACSFVAHSDEKRRSRLPSAMSVKPHAT